MNTLLIIDDEKAVRYSFQRMFEDEFRVITAENGIGGLKVLSDNENTIDVIFLDIKMPGMSGLEVLRDIKKTKKNLPVIMMTAFSDSDTAIEAMKEGAFDYLTKPLEGAQLRDVIEKAISSSRLQHAAFCFDKDRWQMDADTIVGRSRSILDVSKMIGQVAGSDVPVLVTGESGVGKELVARAIYNHSRRKGYIFIAVNCAALPEPLVESELFGSERGAFTGADRKRIGRFEQCKGGTIFLDEIGEMSIATQAKLLRVLQDGSFQRLGSNEPMWTDVRIIAASNKDLEREVEEGRFRRDLYHRLNVFAIHIDPLRNRKEDIPDLAEYFIARIARDTQKDIKGISAEAAGLLLSYDWPGNVRELGNVIKRAVVVAGGDIIDINDVHLPPATCREDLCDLAGIIANIFDRAYAEGAASGLFKCIISSSKKTLITKALAVTKGNQVRASELLGITRVTLRKKMKEYNIPPA